MIRAAVAVAALALAAALAGAQEGGYVVARDTPQWFKETFYDFNEDVEEASAEGKRLLIYFGQDGCPYCRQLHEVNWKQKSIVDYMRARFDSVVVNMFGDVEVTWVDGKTYTEKTLSQKLGIQFTPTQIVLDSNGEEALRLAGYQPPQKYAHALRYAAAKQSEPFADYMRRQLRAQTLHEAPPPLSQPPHALAKPGKKTAALITETGCLVCDEWREQMRDDPQWRQNFNLVELSMAGKTPAAVDGKESEAEWAKRMKIAFAPTIVFLSADGNEIFRIDGYLRAFHLESVRDYIATDARQSEPEFQRFLQARADRLRKAGQTVVIW